MAEAISRKRLAIGERPSILGRMSVPFEIFERPCFLRRSADLVGRGSRRRFAAAAVIAEELEAKLARGEAIDIAEHALLCSTLVRVARQIGVNRIVRDVTPSLRDIINEGQTCDGAPAD
jgi:hypothetical protein